MELTHPVGAEDRLELQRLMSTFNDDEVAVFLFLAKRLAKGSVDHGKLNLATDRRDYQNEVAEEFGDAMFYMAFEFVRRSMRRAA